MVTKSDTLRKHERSNDHTQAVAESLELKQFKKATASANSKAEASITSAMKIVYTQAKEHLATRKFSVLKELCVDLGCPNLTSSNVDKNTN